MKRMQLRNSMLGRMGLLLILGLWASTSLSAQTNSLLWEISGNGLEKKSYLYGTVHLICADDFVITDATKKALTSAGQVVMEIDMDDPQELSSVQMGMMAPGGIDYQAMMSENAYAKLDSTLRASVGMGMGMLKMAKPFGIMSMLTLSTLDCGQPESYEGSFMEMAKKQEKEILGLESGISQVRIFDEIALEEQIGWLTEMVTNPEKGKKEWEQLMVAYKSSDVEAIYESMSSSPEYKEYEDELLTNRNTDWIGKMEKMAKDKSTFFAVGAAHLGGNKGVINLLKEAGYTLKPVMD